MITKNEYAESELLEDLKRECSRHPDTAVLVTEYAWYQGPLKPDGLSLHQTRRLIPVYDKIDLAMTSRAYTFAQYFACFRLVIQPPHETLLDLTLADQFKCPFECVVKEMLMALTAEGFQRTQTGRLGRYNEMSDRNQHSDVYDEDPLLSGDLIGSLTLKNDKLVGAVARKKRPFLFGINAIRNNYLGLPFRKKVIKPEPNLRELTKNVDRLWQEEAEREDSFGMEY